MLIYISDDRSGVGQRMMSLIEESKNVSRPFFVSPLDQWEKEDDISLYIIRQPINELSTLIRFLRGDGADLWERVQQSPKTYFVLSFSKCEWQEHQTILLKYDFFNKAKVKTI